MKEKLRKSIVVLGLVSALAGCRDDSLWPASNIESKLVYSGVLKRGQPVRFTYDDEEHQVKFDSLRVLSSRYILESKSLSRKEESAIRYFTLDGENRIIIEAIGVQGNYIAFDDADANLIKTKKFQIMSSLKKGDVLRSNYQFFLSYPEMAKGSDVEIEIREVLTQK